MPWPRDSFESELDGEGTGFSWVVEADGRPEGYIISWLVEDELHIGNIAVAPGLQGAGLGQAVLARCLSEAVALGVTRASLEVRVSNERAIALYGKNGFIPVAMRKRYYSDSGEDAVVMLKCFAEEDSK